MKSLAHKYPTQIAMMKQMGFNDEHLLGYLLETNGGNVQRVVEWMLSHGIS